MQPQPEHWTKIEVKIEASNERLLEGLDVWLHLGLISDQEVKRLCCQYLSCTIPAVTEARQVTKVTLTQPGKLPQNELVSTTITRTAQVLQSLMAEFSLMWLLFLGVFMVVVSSGVLAASQWRQVTPQGQYLILLGYTLAFWVASARIGRHENLRLTARMLKIATLLIIPVNFWMIDGLKLWRSGVGLAIALFAAVILTALIIRLLKSTTNTQHQQLILINSVGLSWLHWGWGWASFPIVATYIGTVGTAFSLFYQYQRNEPLKQSKQQFSLGTIAVTAATLLLLTRAIFVVKIPSQLGLAIAICGWLCCWLSQRNYTQENQEISNRPLNIAGVVLLLIGWLVCVTTIPLQAITISGLGLWLLFTRLRQRLQVQDLSAIFLVGLQLFWLLWRLISVEFRRNLLAFCIKIAGTAFMPQALLSVALFPYVLLTLFFATRLRRWQQPILANQTEVLALLLGLVLTSLSLLNPLVRSLNLLLSSLTLAVVTQKRATAQIKLIYGTHIIGLAAIVSGINLFFPDLGIRAWTSILLGIMVAEWSFSVGSTWRSWRRSAWFIGLGLAAISYVLLLREFTYSKDATGWSLIGLLIPVTLTAIASKPQFFQQRLASWLSVGGLCLIQLLTFNSIAPRLTSLGITTIIMLLNTRQLQQLFTAVIAVGFGLAFSGAVLGQIFQHISFELFVNIVAIAPLALWLLPLVSKQRTTLARIYTQATDGWAITIASLYLILMSLYEFFIYTTVVSRELLLANLVITTAIIYRTFIKPTNLGFYGIAWSLEVLVAAIATQSATPLGNLAIANLVLGLTIQITGDWWVRSGHNYRSSWHVIPLIYAISACLLQHFSFTASSGLFTLGAALIGIGIGRRHQHYKFLSYFSLLGGSIAAYELVTYQLLQVPNSSLSNELIILAGLGTVIAICYYLFARWLVSYLRLTRNELDVIADLHWAVSSGFVALALLISPSFGAVLVTTILAIYALIQGRSSENWTYAGIIEAVAAFSFLLDLAYPDSQWLVAWSSAIASIFAFGIYSLPWNTWGWSLHPWRRAAYVLPGLFICLSIGNFIAIQSLLIAAAVYAWFAKGSGKVRLSYVSIILADWAIARLFRIYGLDEPLWYATLLGSSLLYLTQVDPALQASTEKEKRHLLRCLATGLICLTALYQAEANLLLGLLTIGFSIGFILTGLALRIRAFLYIGTVSFIVQIGRQIWFFIHDYSLTLWAVGIVLGITFIWIAANFESRREQMTSMLQEWVTELEDWD